MLILCFVILLKLVIRLSKFFVDFIKFFIYIIMLFVFIFLFLNLVIFGNKLLFLSSVFILGMVYSKL